MNTLFKVSAPLGDSIIFSCLLKDYKEMFPNETLYILHNNFFIDLFKNNSLVNIYNNTVKYDKIFDYNLYKINANQKYSERPEMRSLQDVPYWIFEHLWNVKLLHNNYTPCVELDDYQKTQIESDKPICLINPMANFCMLDGRTFGIRNYQQIINKFKDKLNFVTVGNGTYNLLLQNKPLQNVWKDLINKTSVYELLKWINSSSIILTHESGIWHASTIKSNKPRDVIVLFGARWTNETNYYKTPNVNIHYIQSQNLQFYKEHCYQNITDIDCKCAPLISKINNIPVGNVCKSPVLFNGELLSDCMVNIGIEKVEQEIINILNK